LLLAVRLFCAGVDVYWPGSHIVLHLWSREHRPVFHKPEKIDPNIEWIKVNNNNKIFFSKNNLSIYSSGQVK